MGKLYGLQKLYGLAIEQFKKSIELNPEYADPYLSLGITFFTLNEYTKAIEQFKKAIELNKSDAYNNLGVAYHQMKNYTEAIENYKKTIKLNSKDTFAYYNLGLAYEAIQEFELALKAFENFLKFSGEEDKNLAAFATEKVQELKTSLNGDGIYAKINQHVSKIKKLLVFKGDYVTHYTGLLAAKTLILSESNFRMSEATFLNDPSEGQALFTFLGVNEDLSKQLQYEVTSKPFIASFVPESKFNDLMFWRMYGKENNEEAKGCALTIKSKSLIDNINSILKLDKLNTSILSTTDEYSFYSVAYLVDNEFSIPHSEHENEFKGELQSLKTEVNKIKADKSYKNWAKVIEKLNEIAFLFKTSAFQYESEIRLVMNGVGFEKHILHENNLPKVYLEVGQIGSLLEKITLGPRVERAEEWAAALHYSLAKKSLKPEIYISQIPFK